MKNPLHYVKVAAAKALTKLVMQALANARSEPQNRASWPTKAQASGISKRFMKNFNNYFDEIGIPLIEQAKSETDEFASLSQIGHYHLEAMVAMEGMVKQRREAEIAGMSSLTVRLESILPGIRVDEANNPFDPEQIADCFNEAIKPMELEAQHLLKVYEEFDKSVFGELESIVAKINTMMISMKVLPELETHPQDSAKHLEGKVAEHAQPLLQQVEENPKIESEPESKSAHDSSQSSVNENSKSTEQTPPAVSASKIARTDWLAHMQQLLHSKSGQSHALVKHATENVEIASNTEMAADEERMQVQQESLLELLDRVQFNLQNSSKNSSAPSETNAAGVAQAINESLKQAQENGELGPIQAQSADVINLIVVLFDIIEKDEALLAVLKELVRRIQIVMMKIALRDTSFFYCQDNPARRLIDELIHAGVGWTQSSKLDANPVYHTTKRILKMLLDEPKPDNDYIETLLGELRQAKTRALGKTLALESRILNLPTLTDHPDDIDAFVRQKIHERIRNRDLDPFIQILLKTYIHNFLFKLVTREGFKGQSWKSVVSTLDVLLWTMQPEKQFGDLERFKRVNPRLLENLSKFLSIGGASKSKITKIMRQLKQIQEFTFYQAEAGIRPEHSEDQESFTRNVILSTRGRKEVPPLKKDDPNVVRIGGLPLDSWIEFRGSSGERLRCTLASKIESIDKLFFTNSDGEKVLEITRLRLAHELKAGTVRVISEGMIMKRAMQSVIAYLSKTSRTGARAEDS